VDIGVKAEVTDHDLAFVGNMRSHPGDGLQKIYRLLLGAGLTGAMISLSGFADSSER
jgi:hypothetical protein